LLFLSSLEKFRLPVQEKCVPFVTLYKLNTHSFYALRNYTFIFLIITLADILYGKKKSKLLITDI